MITTTERAGLRIKQILDTRNLHNKNHGLPEMIGFRLAVKAGGCHGLQYEFYPIYFCNNKYDKIFESNGVKVHVDKKSLAIVDGTEIDHSDNLLEDFIFNNPRAQSACGCGTSFELKEPENKNPA